MIKILLTLCVCMSIQASQYKFAHESFDYTKDTGIVNLEDLFKHKDTGKTARNYYQENIALEDLDFMRDLLDIKNMILDTNNRLANKYKNNYLYSENEKRNKTNIIFIKKKLNKIKDNTIIQLYDINYKAISKLKKNNIFDKTNYMTNEYIYYNNTFNNIYYLKNPKNETINNKLRYKRNFKLEDEDKKNIFILYLNENDNLVISVNSKTNYFSYINKVALFDEKGNEYFLNYMDKETNNEEENFYKFLTEDKNFKKYYYKINITESGLYYLFIDKNKIEKDIEIYLK